MLRFATAALAVAALLTLAAQAADMQSDMGGGGYFVVELEIAHPETLDNPANLELLGQHVGHLRDLYDKGVLFMAGPLDEGGEEGLAVVTAGSADEARSYFESDPSVQAGFMLIEDVHQWWTPFSRPDNKTFSTDEFKAMMAAQPPMDKSAMEKAEADDADDRGADMDEAGDMDDNEAEDMDEPGDMDEKDGEEMDENKAIDGALVHFNMPSTNFQRTQDFYGRLFGWEFVPMMDSYMLFQTPGGQGGGFTTDYAPGDGGGVFYIYAADVPAKLKDVTAAGGKVVLDTIPVPGYGWVAEFTDPDGNRVGLFSGENPPAGESPVPEM